MPGIAGRIMVDSYAPAFPMHEIEPAIQKVAADLKANNGAALVVSGSNDLNVQIIVNAINNAIGAYGTTIDCS